MASDGINGPANHNLLFHDHPVPLKIAIVGAGIGGLSAAIALRRQGHQVTLYEQSRFVTETGAAVHLAPNSNGILRRWGLFPEEIGAVNCDGIIEKKASGEVVSEVEMKALMAMWQHPWQLVHRVNLQNKLKEIAMAENGPGTPAGLHTSSKVLEADPESGTIRFENGDSVTADLVVGADGINSKTRVAVYGKEAKLFSSNRAAFRFLIATKAAREDPMTAQLVAKQNTMHTWYGSDRRAVMYPCNNNETLNFVLIHPDAESHATASDGWDKSGSVEHLLKIYEGFDPELLALVKKVDPAELKVWQLMDMEKLPTWIKGKLALIGDAAHPFTPHQGQGAGQAMEDAAALAAVLPKGVDPKDVPERLELYEKIRYERAHHIQEFSRQAGKDWVGGKPQIDMMTYSTYNFGHDEVDNSAHIFKKWLRSKNPNQYWRMPISFGPAQGPRQDGYGRPFGGHTQRTFRTASIKFKTSRTYLQTLFPNENFKFASPATVAQASISLTTLDKMAWLGGKGYNHVGLYIHGVQYTKKDGSKVNGTYLPVLFESLADPITTGRDELGMNKTYCEIDIQEQSNSLRMQASWRGAKFLDFNLNDLKEDDPKSEAGTIGGEADYGILAYKYIPATGEPGKADVEYAVVVPHEEEAKVAQPSVQAVARSSSSSIKFDAGDWTSLPTLHHIASALAEVPIYEIIAAKVVRGFGVSDVSSARRIE